MLADELGAADELAPDESDELAPIDSDELAPGMHDSDELMDSEADIEADSDELMELDAPIDSDELADSDAPIDSDDDADPDAEADSDAIELGDSHADGLELMLSLAAGVDVAPATLADGVEPELEQAAATRTTASSPPMALIRRVMGIPHGFLSLGSPNRPGRYDTGAMRRARRMSTRHSTRRFAREVERARPTSAVVGRRDERRTRSAAEPRRPPAAHRERAPNGSRQ